MLNNLRKLFPWMILLAVVAGATVWMPRSGAQEETRRKITKQVQPVYPALAAQLRLAGTVKIVLLIAPDGKVKSTHTIGGNPILASAAEDAAKQWRFEPAQQESSMTVEFKFAGP